jgi:two-component system response regulator RegA
MASPESILLVDDDEAFRDALARALERRDFVVHKAHDIHSALTLAEQHTPPLGIIDLCIGDESGLQVIEALSSCYPDMRLVVLTGFASIATAVEAIKLGARHYLTKPAEIDAIIDALYQDKGNADIDASQQPMSVKRLEWEHIQKTLADHDGNISAAARALGMHRRTLQRKLQKRPARQ